MLLIACTSPIARNLDDSAANRVIVALAQSGISGAKDADPENDGKWVVSVPRTDVPDAVSVLTQDGLPGNERPGVVESAARGSLVPSLQTEQVRLLAGVAGDLEKSVSQLDGVLTVRVHIASAQPDPLVEPNQVPATSASVLIRHNKNYSELSNEAVRRLVAGAVPNLSPEHVTVISMPITAANAPRDRAMVALGPFAVSRNSVWGLRVLVCGFAALNLVLLAQLLLFWRKIRAFRAEQTAALMSRAQGSSP